MLGCLVCLDCWIIIYSSYCLLVPLSECAHLLLAHNAPVKVKNAQGWSPLAEAISYGDRQMSKYASLRQSFETSPHVTAIQSDDTFIYNIMA